jgi:hypothetical protein
MHFPFAVRLSVHRTCEGSLAGIGFTIERTSNAYCQEQDLRLV